MTSFLPVRCGLLLAIFLLMVSSIGNIGVSSASSSRNEPQESIDRTAHSTKLELDEDWNADVREYVFKALSLEFVSDSSRWASSTAREKRELPPQQQPQQEQQEGIGGDSNSVFTWSDCSQPGSPVSIKTLQLTPDPIRVPGTASLNLVLTSEQAVGGPIKLDLKIFKLIFKYIWHKLDCTDGMGSCLYEDVCTVLKEKFPSCPGNTTCHCPFPAGSPHLQRVFQIPTPRGIPLQLVDGKYHVIANATHTGSDGHFNFCIDLHLALHVDL
ncbi:ganglioside GM2 activator-like [Sycon ciliatum]|uniref:ganglioside GM2 activator-like n=1 Tax=Sycon ciliatum TaxID=27933 RepID=UPI0031F6588E